MGNILEKITNDIREARLKGDRTRLDDLVVLKQDIAHGLSQKQPIKAQKTITTILTTYKQTQALLRDSAAVQRYQEKIELLESYLAPSKTQLDTNALQQLLLEGNYSSIREWMAFLKKEYPDQYDGRLASTLFNQNEN